MRFTIVTHVPHLVSPQGVFAYGPYVREINIWLSHVDEVEIVCPVISRAPQAIEIAYSHPKIKITAIPSFDMLGAASVFKMLWAIPVINFQLFFAMLRSNHIHLRCPGNIGLLGCVMQLLFPLKRKTAKYAGNWDPNAAQPLSYRLQKRILNSTFLTHNMSVLVYGKWASASKNIVSFFTATYAESDKEVVQPRQVDGQLAFLFVGTLSEGKRPLYALQLVEKLHESGQNIHITFYGEGAMRHLLNDYIVAKKLENIAVLAGNAPEIEVRQAYKKAHFVLLPSKSEGWPKVIAEAMFWGSAVAATNVSCVPYMVDSGNRGLLLSLDIDADAKAITDLIADKQKYEQMTSAAQKWSRAFTLDRFDNEIQKLVRP